MTFKPQYKFLMVSSKVKTKCTYHISRNTITTMLVSSVYWCVIKAGVITVFLSAEL